MNQYILVHTIICIYIIYNHIQSYMHHFTTFMYTHHVLTKKTSSWLVVSTPLKNISQIGSSSQIYIMYKKNKHLSWLVVSTPLKHIPTIGKNKSHVPVTTNQLPIMSVMSYSYGHLPVRTGYKWDYTFYKWGYKYL